MTSLNGLTASQRTLTGSTGSIVKLLDQLVMTVKLAQTIHVWKVHKVAEMVQLVEMVKLAETVHLDEMQWGLKWLF